MGKKSRCWFRIIEMWHATLTKNVEVIKKNGFTKSEVGRIGKGCYFTKNYYAAKKIAQVHVSQKNGGQPASILRVSVACKGGLVNLGDKTLSAADQNKEVAQGRVLWTTPCMVWFG